MLVQNFPSEFLPVKLGDIKDDPPDVLDRRGCGGQQHYKWQIDTINEKSINISEKESEFSDSQLPSGLLFRG